MKKYEKKFSEQNRVDKAKMPLEESSLKEVSSPGAKKTLDILSRNIVELYNDSVDYSTDEMEALDSTAEDLADIINDSLYDMFGPDRKLQTLFKKYLVKYLR